jgi:hypothetical protein
LAVILTWTNAKTLLEEFSKLNLYFLEVKQFLMGGRFSPVNSSVLQFSLNPRLKSAPLYLCFARGYVIKL